ncbi:MAG TPA: Gfo/Idh/MocA family oxidoreductase, partial [Stenotrophomonas sp.]|nr:Gfo/Idh/MocA family oxidoreductase [Stenotrophomonas sp.]
MNARLQTAAPLPRLGFLGVGWIGCQRMQALADAGVATVAAIADPHAESLARAAQHAPGARQCRSIGELLDADDLDGIVIATPSGAHALQAIAALQRGLAVFCQKPLTRTAAEAEQVLEAARAANRHIAVDFSYRAVAGVPELREQVQQGALGEVYAVDLVFHNAYGPDKAWFYELAQSGGGCVMDLGTHLVDMAQWICGSTGHADMSAALFAQGQRLQLPADRVEDYAVAQWRLDSGAQVRLACSWRLPAGCEAVIQAAFYGTGGGAALSNVGGSFYDF